MSIYNKAEIERFFLDTGPTTTDITRGGRPTAGSHAIKGAGGGPLLPVYRLSLPRRVSAEGHIPSYVRLVDRADGWLMIVCTGTGAAYRVPMIYTDAMLHDVAVKMQQAMSRPWLTQRNADDEAPGLEVAAVQMEVLFAHHLTKLDMDYALPAYKVDGAELSPWTQDCVDQAANGTAYAMIWADAGLMKFHRPYYPGYNSPIHFYSRLQRIDTGRVLAFDLYHRSAGIGKGTPVRVGGDPNAPQAKNKGGGWFSALRAYFR